MKNTVIKRKNFRPHRSDNAPISGALKKERNPLMPIIKPFIKNVCSGNVRFRTVIAGNVRRPHAKNSKKITTIAWKREGFDDLDTICETKNNQYNKFSDYISSKSLY